MCRSTLGFITPLPELQNMLDKNLWDVVPTALPTQNRAFHSYIQIHVQFFFNLKKNCRYSSHMVSSFSHVVSSAPYQVIWTFSNSIDLLLRTFNFESRICVNSTWNYPSCSTSITFQSITWLGSGTYLSNKATWNTLWIIMDTRNLIMYAIGPIFLKTSNGP
jgi:hypothetical protein